MSSNSDSSLKKYNQIKNGWFYERNSIWPGAAMGYEVEEILVDELSEYQHILIFKSKNHGNILVLDGIIQLTEKQEFTYHEMIVHTPMFAHLNPKKILVIGAGDGGVIRELVKHESVEEIVWCEIDNKVIEYCEKYFSEISCSNKDKRVKLNCGDAFLYVKNTKDNTFDIIISDTTDPEGFGEALFSEKFYKDCYRILKAGGILATQGECIWHSLSLISDIINFSNNNNNNDDNNNNDNNNNNNNNNMFYISKYASIFVPFYPFGQIGIIICRKYCPNLKRNNLLDINKPIREIPNHILKNLKYYDQKVHEAAFVLPKFVKDHISNFSKSKSKSKSKL